MAGSLFIARSITRPVQRLAEAAQRIQRGDYTRRLEVESKDEIGELAVSFNHMLDGIESRESEILRLAYEDGLTALPNRAMFNEQLEQAVRTARRAAQPLAVLLFDMDRFKAINDTLGHPVGDQALREVGMRVRHALRDSDIVARLGGDEFAVLLATGDAERAPGVVAQKILKALEEPLVIDGPAMDIAASIGIARFPEHGDGRGALMRAADVAMYVAKRSKARLRDLRPGATTSAARSTSRCWGSCAARWRPDELVLHYQPKIDLADGARDRRSRRWCAGATRVRGFIPPARVHPVRRADRLHQRASRAGCCARRSSSAAQWHRAGCSMRMCVNVSARDLRNGGCAGAIRGGGAARRGACRPACCAWRSPRAASWTIRRSAQTTLRKLRELGVATSIDDYGTGYSSLAYIKQLRGERAEDRPRVRQRHGGRQAQRRHRALDHRAGPQPRPHRRGRGRRDRPRARASCARFGCDIAQGYHFARADGSERLHALDHDIGRQRRADAIEARSFERLTPLRKARYSAPTLPVIGSTMPVM